MSEPDRGYRAEIDGLRAIAVVAVILYHLGVGAFTGGYVGVDVFFVISGFLIVGIVWRQCDQGRFRLGEFYRRRVLRLFPALLLVCAVTLAAGLVVLLPSDLSRLGKSLAATMGYVSNVWLWRNTGYFDAKAESLPLLHTWSLSVEEQFYLVLPISLLLLHRVARSRAVLVMVSVACLTLALSQALLTTRQSAVFYLTPFRAWEFLVGGGLAVTGWTPRSPLVRSVCRWLALALVVAPVFVLDQQTDFPGLSALAPCVGAALLLSCVSSESDVVSRFLRSAPMVWVGKRSYSLYLWHWPVLVLWAHADRPPESAVAIGTVLVLTVVLSMVSYSWVETPLRQPEAPRARLVFLGSLGGSGLLGAAGVAMFVGAGLPQRFSRQVVELDRAQAPELPFAACFLPTVPGDDCVLGDPQARPRWLLWGDSHALALAPGLHETLRRRRESAVFIATSTCPPLFGVGSRDLRSGDWRCDEASLRARRALDTMPSIDGVLLVAIWPEYLQPEASCRLRDQQGERGNAIIVTEGLTATLNALSRYGVRSLVVGRVPRHPWSVPFEMARAARAGRPSLSGVSQADEEHAQAPFRTLVSSLTGREDVDVIDMVGQFCANGSCRFENEGRPLYRDAHHLNLEGANLAMRRILPAMDRVPRTADANTAGH